MTPQVTELENGIRVVSEQRQSLQTVSVGVWVGVGSRDEPAGLNGITHFLEHMMFKGTSKRSAKDIVLSIESVGGHINAYTTRESTTYYTRTLKDDLPLALDVLADIVQNSVCDPAEVEREKDVILQEIGQAVDTPDDIVFDYLQEAVYGTQPLGRTILGEPDIIKSFNSDNLLSYLKQNYTGSNIVISAVGNLDHDDLVKRVSDLFSNLPTGHKNTLVQAHYTGGKKFEQRPLEQAHLTSAWPGYSFHAPEYYAMQVYSTIMGGGMSSRLFQEIRENRGLAYSVYSFTSSHADTGIFGLYAGTGPDMAFDLIPVVNDELEKICDGPETWEFEAAKAQLRAGLMMALEATTSRMEQLGRQIIMFDRIIPIEEMTKNVENVTVDKVKDIATGIFSCANSSHAALGPSNFIN